MSNQQKHFEGINAATEAAEFAANHGGEVVHEGVLFTVIFNDDARTVAAAGDPTPGGYPAPGYPAPGYPNGYPLPRTPVPAGFPVSNPNVPNSSTAAAIAAAKARKA